MAITEPARLPVGDIWFFYTDFFNYVDGRYSFWHLFDRHNEHLILTTRLALFVDTIWFGASGKFVLVVAYSSTLVIALMVAHLAAGQKKWEVIGLTAVFLGFACAGINLGNLTMPFQVGFFLVHAFALTTLIGFWQGLAGARWWYALAFACDFMAVFSLGSGVLVGVSAVALAVWAKKIDWLAALFFMFHAALSILAAWLVIGPPGAPDAMLSTPTNSVTYFVIYLGNFTMAWSKWPFPVGVSVAAICAVLFTWLTWRSVRTSDRFTGQTIILAAFALFVILEAVAATFTRAHFGVSQALSTRYTTSTLLLAITLFALAWRSFPQRVSRAAALLALTIAFIPSNDVIFEKGWRKYNGEIDAIANEIALGHLPQTAADSLYISPDVFNGVIWRFRSAGFGPFRRYGG